MFDTIIVKNTGIDLLFQQFYALLLKRIINSMRNYLVLVTAILPVLFVLVSLIIEQQIPKPEDSPPLLMSFDRYQKTNVPYTYNRTELSSINFIRSYESILENSPHIESLLDLTTNNPRPCQDGKPTDIISYLVCIGKRSLLELNDQHLIGVNAEENITDGVLNLTGYFNNQPYHAPPLSLNYLTNALLKQYSPASINNRRIHVVNHPVDKKIKFVLEFFCIF
jgi:ATP-binding cassette subfamily A (ABC1) protein 3